MIVAQGGAFGGWVLYAKDGRPAYCYNLLGLRRFKVYGDTEIPAGEHQVRAEFAYDGGGLGKGGTVTLYVDGKPVGEGRVDGTQPMIFSGDETTDVGSDTATPVSDDYSPRTSTFTGRIRWVQIDLGDGRRGRRSLITPGGEAAGGDGAPVDESPARDDAGRRPRGHRVASRGLAAASSEMPPTGGPHHAADRRTQSGAGRVRPWCGRSWRTPSPGRTGRRSNEITVEQGHEVGEVRRVRSGWITTRERVLRFEPPSRYVYEIVSGLPIRDYVAEVQLAPLAGDGTEVRWRATFRARLPGTGWALKRQLERVIRKAVDALVRRADEIA